MQGRGDVGWWKLLRPEEYMFFFFATLLLVLLFCYGFLPILNKETVIRIGLAYLVMLVFILYSGREELRSRDRGERKMFIDRLKTTTRDWMPFILLILVYENLHDLVKVIRPELADKTLMRIDEFIFGVEPTLWLQEFINPLLTDFMAFSYALYFIIPAALAGILYYKGRRGDFRQLMMALIISYYLGFIGYMTIPAIGPRFIIADEFTVKLEGIFLYSTSADVWNSLESINRDCFPSLHTAQAAIALFFAFKFRDIFRVDRILFWIYLPLVASLWFSTVYLRYHWTIDVIVGLLLAYVLYKAAPRIENLWHKKVRPLPRNRCVLVTGKRIDKRTKLR